MIIAKNGLNWEININKNEHTAPWECKFGKEDKNMCRSGKKPKSDQEYFEILCLCILQAGLSWGMVRKNWPKFKKGFYDFDIKRLANGKVNNLLKRDKVIKNENKLEAIIENAKKFQQIIKEHSTFENFIKSLKSMEERETIKKLAHQLKHVGVYTAEYFLHSIGYWR